MYHSISFALVNLDEIDRSVSFTPGKYGLNSTDYTVMVIKQYSFLDWGNLSKSTPFWIYVDLEIREWSLTPYFNLLLYLEI